MSIQEAIPVVDLSFPDILDNTTVSCYALCKRKFYYAHLLHLHPDNVSIHLHAGAAYATAHESFRKAYWSEGSSTYKDIDASLVVALRSLFLAYGYDPEQEDYWASTNKGPERMAEALVQHYLVHFDPRSDPVRPYIINGEPAVEQSFTLSLDIQHPNLHEPIHFHGRFDMLVEYHGGVFIFDDKTTSQLGATWFPQWDFRSQFTGYIKGAQTFDVPVLGAIVRGHCFLKNEVKFAQAISQRASWQVDEWWDDLHATVFDMTAYYKRALDALSAGEDRYNLQKYFPANGKFNGGCNMYSGCEYQQLCSTNKPQRYFNRYRVRIWDPRNPDKD